MQATRVLPRALEWPEYRVLYPCPDTPQYGLQGKRYLTHYKVQLPSQGVACEGWCQANLQNRCDFQEKTIAEKYLVGQGSTNWFYLKIDGWLLTFWAENSSMFREGSVHPMGFLDLRAVRHIEGYEEVRDFDVSCPYMVSMHTQTGWFSFRVQTGQDMSKWIQNISQALAESVRIERVRRDTARNPARTIKQGIVPSSIKVRNHNASGRASDLVKGKDQMMHYTISSHRSVGLGRLWRQCINMSASGENKPDLFADMFALYDLDGNRNLDIEELEVMLRELLLVRRQELTSALDEQRKVIFNEQNVILNIQAEEGLWQARVGDLGKRLLAHYNHMLEGGGFDSRAAILRSNLDTSCDNVVTLNEFLRGAPHLLLPRSELMLECEFYTSCEQALVRANGGQDLHEKDDGRHDAGCLHQ